MPTSRRRTHHRSHVRSHTTHHRSHTKPATRHTGTGTPAPVPAPAQAEPVGDFVLFWFIMALVGSVVIFGMIAIIKSLDHEKRQAPVSPKAQWEIVKIDRERRALEAKTAEINAKANSLNRESQKAVNKALQDAPRIGR